MSTRKKTPQKPAPAKKAAATKPAPASSSSLAAGHEYATPTAPADRHTEGA